MLPSDLRPIFGLKLQSPTHQPFGTIPAVPSPVLARTYTATPQGIQGVPIEIEAIRHNSLPVIHITGLPGDIVKESRERIRGALAALGFEVPSSRIVVHLSPANVKKQGSHFDLGIAVGVLGAEGMLHGIELSNTAFLGELSLDGRVQAVPNALSLIETLERHPTIKNILLPKHNAWEASLLKSTKSRLVSNLAEVVDFLKENKTLECVKNTLSIPPESNRKSVFDHIIGQDLAKRALLIALAGRHHLLLLGQPGIGKSLLASTASTLLPFLDLEGLIQVSKIYETLGFKNSLSFERPFRSPHHTISAQAFLGGGSGNVVAGEVSLSHMGVLFLDEFPEFRRDAIEGLREPMETGIINLHRVGHSVSLPARFNLIAAMNPCPCGYHLSPNKTCSCSPERILTYRKKVSGPLLDRIDLCVLMSSPKNEQTPILTSGSVRENILKALELQKKRFQWIGKDIQNGDAPIDRELSCFRIGSNEKKWLEKLQQRMALSYRGYHKILRISRTIADIEGSEVVKMDHLREAWSLRCPPNYTTSSLA